MRKRVADQQVPGGGVLGGDGGPGAGDLSWTPPDEAPAEPSFEEMWAATAGAGFDEEDPLAAAEEAPPGGDDGGVQQSDSQIEDVPALPAASEPPVAEGDVPQGSGDGAGPDLTEGGRKLIEVSADRIFAGSEGTSPTKALTKLIKDKKERKMAKTDTKSPEHREKLRKALKAYWAKRRKEGGGGAKKSKTKTKTKAAPSQPLPHAARKMLTGDGAADITAAYLIYHGAVKAAKETLRKAILEILDHTV